MAELIAARTVQGLGGAVVLPLSLTILTTAFPPERRGMIVGIYGGLAGLAVAHGTDRRRRDHRRAIDWHWIFWINVPIGVVAVLLGVRLLPESYGAPERLDLVGVGLVTAGVVALVWALTRANDVGWASAEIIGTPHRRAPRCLSRSSGGSAAPPSRWCRCALFADRDVRDRQR